MIHVVSMIDYVLRPVFAGMNKSIHVKKYIRGCFASQCAHKKVEEWGLDVCKVSNGSIIYCIHVQ